MRDDSDQALSRREFQEGIQGCAERSLTQGSEALVDKHRIEAYAARLLLHRVRETERQGKRGLKGFAAGETLDTALTAAVVIHNIEREPGLRPLIFGLLAPHQFIAPLRHLHEAYVRAEQHALKIVELHVGLQHDFILTGELAACGVCETLCRLQTSKQHDALLFERSEPLQGLSIIAEPRPQDFRAFGKRGARCLGGKFLLSEFRCRHRTFFLVFLRDKGLMLALRTAKGLLGRGRFLRKSLLCLARAPLLVLKEPYSLPQDFDILRRKLLSLRRLRGKQAFQALLRHRKGLVCGALLREPLGRGLFETGQGFRQFSPACLSPLALRAQRLVLGSRSR